MDYKKELGLLVEYVKESMRAKGEKITNEEIADRLGFKRIYLSQLLHGHKPTTESHILKFKEKFKKELPDESKVTPDDILIIHSSLEVIMRELAKLQSELPKGEDASKYLNELKKEIKLVAIERKGL